jgi:hypothetical protein
VKEKRKTGKTCETEVARDGFADAIAGPSHGDSVGWGEQAASVHTQHRDQDWASRNISGNKWYAASETSSNGWGSNQDNGEDKWEQQNDTGAEGQQQTHADWVASEGTIYKSDSTDTPQSTTDTGNKWDKHGGGESYSRGFSWGYQSSANKPAVVAHSDLKSGNAWDAYDAYRPRVIPPPQRRLSVIPGQAQKETASVQSMKRGVESMYGDVLVNPSLKVTQAPAAATAIKLPGGYTPLSSASTPRGGSHSPRQQHQPSAGWGGTPPVREAANYI